MINTNDTGVDEHYEAWLLRNDEWIIQLWGETEECWNYACEMCVQDGVYSDDVDGVTNWIQSHIKLKHVPQDFIDKHYEDSIRAKDIDLSDCVPEEEII